MPFLDGFYNNSRGKKPCSRQKNPLHPGKAIVVWRQSSYNKRQNARPGTGRCAQGEGKMYKNVLFDLDGTLLNTIDDLADAGNRVCAARGWPTHTPEQFRYLVGNGIPKLIERFTPEQFRTPETLADACRAFDADYGAHMFDKTRPYPGMPELLAQLAEAGVRMAVFSNKDDALARRVVSHYFDTSLFVMVRGALPDVPKKPAPAGTMALMHAMGAGPDDTLYVGDSNVDVLTGHNAGLPCCGVLWGFRTEEELRQAGADYLAADTDGLEQVILGK